MAAFFELDDFLMNPQIRTGSGTVPGAFRNTNGENQKLNEDRSQDYTHPEVGPSVYHSRHSNESDPDEAPHRGLCVALGCFSISEVKILFIFSGLNYSIGF